MQILLSNDDGFQAEGLCALHRGLVSAGDEVICVAPDRNRSAASNSLTIDGPLRVEAQGDNVFSVNGTPTDCVHLALTGVCEKQPDMVVSGINMGANLGDDVIYSGTVAAAMEGRFLGLPALAVSINAHQPQYLETAVQVVLSLLKNVQAFSAPPDTILNVNVPDISWEDLRGIQATRLGRRHQAEPALKRIDPRGEPIYWIGPPGETKDEAEGTDFYALAHNYASVTPLHIDLTRYSALKNTADWLKACL